MIRVAAMKRMVQATWPVCMLMATLLLSGCGAVSGADEKVFMKHREADSLERQYLFLASHLGSEKPCFLIHPESLAVAPFNPAGTRASFLRSTCFSHVADYAGNETLCQHVRSVSTFLYSGDRLNAERCREAASSPSHVRMSGSLDVSKIVALAGHSYSDIDSFFVSAGVFPTINEAEQARRHDPARYWNEVRFEFLLSRDFFDSIGELPGFGNHHDLADMAAVRWSQ